MRKLVVRDYKKRKNHLVREDFLSLIEIQRAKRFKNTGFIKENDSATGQPSIKTYTQTKQGLNYFHAKRKILSDGDSTTYLDIISQHFAAILARVGFEKELYIALHNISHLIKH